MYPIVEQYIAARKQADDAYNVTQRALRAERDQALDVIRAESDAHAEEAAKSEVARAIAAGVDQRGVVYHPVGIYQYTTNNTGWLSNQPNIAHAYRTPPPFDQAADDAERAVRDVYRTNLNTADAVRRQAHKDAWDLLDTSDDPLVRYIYAHCHSYPDHAVRILEILPADLPAIQEVARQGGWCEVFDGFAAGAVRQKLLTDGRTPQRRKLEKYLVNELDVYSDTRRDILDLVDAEVTAAVKRALTAERRKVREAAAKKTTAKVAVADAVTA